MLVAKPTSAAFFGIRRNFYRNFASLIPGPDGKKESQLVVGCGPRGAQSTVAFIAERLRFSKYFEALGIRIDMHIPDMQAECEAGRGKSFCSNSESTLNTRIDERLDLVPAPMDCSPIDNEFEMILNPGSQIREYFADHADEIADDLEACCLPSLALFKFNQTAGEEGGMEMGRAFSNRSTIGKFKNRQIIDAVQYANENVEGLRILIHPETRVLEIKPNGKKLQIVTDGPETPALSQLFDSAHLNTGTSWQPLVSGPPLARTFLGTPSAERLGLFFAKLDLLDNDGMLKPGTNLGISGISLSAYDQLFIALNFTKIAKMENKAPYRLEIDPMEAKRYPGLFTFLSRTTTGIAPPRHAHSQQWTGKRDPIISNFEVHAAFLQQQLDVIDTGMFFAKCQVAAEFGKFPCEIFSEEESVDDKMRSFDEMNERSFNHLEKGDLVGASYTEAGLYRQCLQAIANGSGFEKNVEEAEDAISKEIPLTRHQREGWPMQRAIMVEPCNGDVSPESNVQFQKSERELQLWLAASPIHCQALVASLFKHGVASWCKADIRTCVLNTRASKILVGGKQFDGLLAPYVITDEADKLATNLHLQIAEQDDLPRFDKGRFYVTKDGEHINVDNYGITGHGKKIGGALQNRKWADTNSDQSANKIASSSARIRILCSILRAIGYEHPAKALFELYKTTLPTDEEYSQEVAKLEVHFKNYVLKYNYLMAANEAAKKIGDPNLFGACFTNAHDPKNIGEHFAELESLYGPFKFEPLSDEFIPASRDSFYFEYFVDYTPDELVKITEKVLNLAKAFIK